MTGGSPLAALAPGDRLVGCTLGLAHLPGIGPATLRRCLVEHGAEHAWCELLAGRPDRVPPVAEQLARMRPEATPRLLRAVRRRDLSADLARQRAIGRLHLWGTPGYPARLREDPEPPALVFTRGSLALLDRPAVAVVGTRNATLPGRQLAEELAAGIAAAGVVVVSGLALGIDGAAHRGAVGVAAAHGPVPTVGVVASGLDVPYPRRHADLHATVGSRGLLVSESPAGLRPEAWRFPARNRIIAALADAVVVVESRRTGGSLHTVDEALRRDRPVLAVPGHPSSPAAAGTNALLYDGAGLARDADDVLLELGVDRPRDSRDRQPDPSADLSPAERGLLDALGTTPASLAELVAATGRPVDEVAHALAVLEGRGRIRRTGGWYEADPIARSAR